MSQPLQQISLAKLIPSDANVRRTGRMNGVAELAASIKAHGLLQNLTVRRVFRGKDKTVLFEVVAGGRRLAALKALVKAKHLKKDSRISCHVLNNEIAEEISLAENAHEPMHPADEFEAFALLQDRHGMSIEDIAARFGVTPAVVRQRLKLGAVSPTLRNLYREGEMTLEQLTAFTITDDHKRQEEVWEGLGFNTSRRAILRALTEGQVSQDDRRVTFIGIEAYEAAGGTFARDLFDAQGGYLNDAALLNRLVREKLQRVAETVMAEGWKWVEVDVELDHQRASTMRRLPTMPRPLSEDQRKQLESTQERLEAMCAEAEQDNPSEETIQEIERLEAEVASLTEDVFTPDDIATAGAFVSLGSEGDARILRGYRRPGDELQSAGEGATGEGKEPASEPSGLSASLIAELTAYRTIGLRNDLAQAPELALIAVTHAMAAETFYRFDAVSCLEINVKSSALASVAPGIDDSEAGRAVAERHEAWARRLPSDSAELWQSISDLPMDEMLSLLAHCASLTLNAVVRSGSQGDPAHTSILARSMPHDMTRYWQATTASYLGRVGKQLICDAVREGTGEGVPLGFANLKKQAMAARAEALLTGKGWLPPLLRSGTGRPAA